MEIKTVEQYVLEGLENKERARTDDFFLYGYVLRKLGIDADALKNSD